MRTRCVREEFKVHVPVADEHSIGLVGVFEAARCKDYL